MAWAVILFPPMGAENRACVSFMEARACLTLLRENDFSDP